MPSWANASCTQSQQPVVTHYVAPKSQMTASSDIIMHFCRKLWKLFKNYVLIEVEALRALSIAVCVFIVACFS